MIEIEDYIANKHKSLNQDIASSKALEIYRNHYEPDQRKYRRKGGITTRM